MPALWRGSLFANLSEHAQTITLKDDEVILITLKDDEAISMMSHPKNNENDTNSLIMHADDKMSNMLQSS